MARTVLIERISVGGDDTPRDKTPAQRDAAARANEIDRPTVRKLTNLTDADIDNSAYGFPACYRKFHPIEGVRQVWAKDLVVRWRDELCAFAKRLK